MSRTDLRAVWWLTVLFIVAACGPVLYAQAAVANGTPVEAGTANEWGGSLVWAFFTSSALEWMKRNKWITIFTEQTAFYAQRVVGVLLAAAAAVGVHWTYDPAAGTLMIGGLQWAMIQPAITETIRQWVLQEMTYRTTIKSYRPEVTATATE